MTSTTVVALDIETKSTTDDSDDALNPRRSIITCIGVVSVDEDFRRVYRAPWTKFIEEVYNNKDLSFIGANFKFDLKHMHHHFGEMPNWQERWVDDTRLMAFVCTEKIPQEYLDAYEERRKIENDKLPAGVNHRKAGLHSLKTLAPYFLDVPPFWENPADHDSDEYVLKDCEYTYRLGVVLANRLKELDQYSFYKQKLMPWTKMILEAELEGVLVDRDKIQQLQNEYKKEIENLEGDLKKVWAEHFQAYIHKSFTELNDKYQEMFQHAAMKNQNRSLVDLQLRYVNLYENAKKKLIESKECELNLASPAQLKWLLRDRLGLDVTNLDGDESTDKEVLNKLAQQDGNVNKLLRLRKLTKLVTAFFPKYLELMTEKNKIHAEYNLDGTRTGRLSCSSPNLQQHPRELKELFLSGPEDMFVTYDVTAIEPLLMAYYSEDAEMTKLIQEGKSLHSVNAIVMFNLECEEKQVKDLFPKERQISKTVGLSVLYGAGWKQVQLTCQKEGIFFSERECKKMVYAIRDKFKGVWEFKQLLDEEMEKGSVIYNLMGRPMRIDNPEDVYMKAFNTLVQGSASDIVLDIGLEITKKTTAKPLMFIHDSIVSTTRASSTFSNDEAIKKLFSRELKNASTTFKLSVEGGNSDRWE